jgi:hypothetical protein
VHWRPRFDSPQCNFCFLAFRFLHNTIQGRVWLLLLSTRVSGYTSTRVPGYPSVPGVPGYIKVNVIKDKRLEKARKSKICYLSMYPGTRGPGTVLLRYLGTTRVSGYTSTRVPGYPSVPEVPGYIKVNVIKDKRLVCTMKVKLRS